MTMHLVVKSRSFLLMHSRTREQHSPQREENREEDVISSLFLASACVSSSKSPETHPAN